MVKNNTQNINLDLLNDEEIVAALQRQRAGIEKDVDRSIEDFITNINKNAVKEVLKAIKAYGKQEEGFAIWKKFMLHGDDVDLRAKIHDRKISLRKMFALVNQQVKGIQRQAGKSPYSPLSAAKRTLQTVFAPAAGHLMAVNNRGGLNFREETVFGGMMAFRMMYEGPGAVIHPLTAVLAPHMKRAVEEKLLSSYADLKKQAGKPLIDESIVRGLREEVLTEALARFDRLTAQFYGTAQKTPLPEYGFESEQMPEGVKFGIELEGFSTLKKKFPKNLAVVATVFRAGGLAANDAWVPKQDRKFNEWKITIDPSIISPLEFNGRYQKMNQLGGAGMEIVSPILTGPSGRSALMRATALLNVVRFKTNETCGLHMHVSLEDTTLQQKKNLVKALYHNEAVLDQIIDPARRGDNNVFSLSINKVDLVRVDAASTTEELVETINPGKDRNYKFDMTGLVLPHAPPTIQYRGAGGAAYLNTTRDYAVIIGNFTKQALDNSNVRLEDVIGELVRQRDELQKVCAAVDAKNEPQASAKPASAQSRKNIAPGT